MIASLFGFLPSDVNVFRDGELRTILAADLIPGDIVQISAGNRVPADLRLCEVSDDLKFNKAVLTGDSKAVKAAVDRTSANFLDVTPFFSTAYRRARISLSRVHIVFLGQVSE
jgi:sodium/potassium-transporting ATPase subunit alpha